MLPNQTTEDVLVATQQPTELRVSNIPHALDTYLGLGYEAVAVADGWALLTSSAGAIVLRSEPAVRSETSSVTNHAERPADRNRLTRAR